MPTAGRLAAAITFFIYGWYIAITATPFFAEGVAPRYLIPLSIVIAVIVGWKVVGSRLGGGYIAALAHGLTGAFAYSFWMVFLLAFEDMIGRSMRRSYGGPMEAIVDIFSLMLELAQRMLDFNLIVSIIVGGVICAIVAEFFAKRYP